MGKLSTEEKTFLYQLSLVIGGLSEIRRRNRSDIKSTLAIPFATIDESIFGLLAGISRPFRNVR